MKTKDLSFESLKKGIIADAQKKIKQCRHDYIQAMEDCKRGIYDKWFRYHREDDGWSYDMGWQFQNQTTQNDTVKFVRG